MSTTPRTDAIAWRDEGHRQQYKSLELELARYTEGEAWIASKLSEIMAVAVSGFADAVICSNGPFNADTTLNAVNQLRDHALSQSNKLAGAKARVEEFATESRRAQDELRETKAKLAKSEELNDFLTTSIEPGTVPYWSHKASEEMLKRLDLANKLAASELREARLCELNGELADALSDMSAAYSHTESDDFQREANVIARKARDKFLASDSTYGNTMLDAVKEAESALLEAASVLPIDQGLDPQFDSAWVSCNSAALNLRAEFGHLLNDGGNEK